MLKRVLIILLFLISSVLGSNNLKLQITNSLVEKGFENVSVTINSTDVVITLENRKYRYNVDALTEIMKEILEFKEVKMITIVFLKNQIPVVSIKYDNNDFKNVITDEQKMRTLKEKVIISYNVSENMSEVSYSNSSNNKFDIIINPGFKGQFGDYDNPVRAQVNIIPEIRTSFWQGMDLVAQLLIPVYNEFQGEESIHPGIISFNQNFRLKENYFISSSIGYFTENRYGFDISAAKIFFNGDLIAGFNLGYTGYLSFISNKIFYSDLYLWTTNFSVEYRINKYDLTLGILAGKFLYGDNSIRLNINREFGEVEIGFFIVHSDRGKSNGGLNFSIPLFPSTYARPSTVRLRTAESFRWEYKVKGELESLIGITYYTGNTFFRTLKKYNPNLILNKISK
ncbi:YjbH domain-containing protein [Rosettibacter firmus]|uniref:YjbH domain-containing protein n=1 Tax=Rosettibacter firmus TaxID=3111522 RepID=UPI00336C1F4D